MHVFLVAQVAEISRLYTSSECNVFQDWTLCAVQFFLGRRIFHRDCNIEYKLAVSVNWFHYHNDLRAWDADYILDSQEEGKKEIDLHYATTYLNTVFRLTNDQGILQKEK